MLLRIFHGIAVLTVAAAAVVVTSLAMHIAGVENTVEWWGVIVSAFVGAGLFFIGWKTHKVTRYQAGESLRQNIKKNHSMLTQTCDNEILRIDDKNAKKIRASNSAMEMKIYKKTEIPTDEFIREFKLVQRDSEFLQIKEISEYLNGLNTLVDTAKNKWLDHFVLYTWEDSTERANKAFYEYLEARTTFENKLKEDHSAVYLKHLK